MSEVVGLLEIAMDSHAVNVIAGVRSDWIGLNRSSGLKRKWNKGTERKFARLLALIKADMNKYWPRREPK